MFTYYDDSSGLAAFAILFLVLLPLFLILGLAFYVIGSFFLMKIFEKAGVQGKWRAWVPIYNSLVFSKLGDVNPWVTLGTIIAAAVLGQIPYVGWIFFILEYVVLVMIAWRVGTKLNKEWYWLFLWLIPGLGTLIWYGVLAFSKDRWNPGVRPAPWANSFLADTTVWQGIPSQGGAAAGYAAPAPGAAPAGGSYPPPAPGAYPPPAGDVPPAPPAPGAYPPPAGDVPPAPPAPPADDPDAPRV